MEGLSLDNILSEDQIASLFPEDTPQDEGGGENIDNQETKAEEDTAEVDPEGLFEGGPESVGSGDDTGDKKDTSSGGSSDFYSSIANALVEDGIFQNLSEDEIKKIKSAEDFAEAISSQIKNQFDERQKRVDEALRVGVEPNEIHKHERLLAYLNTIDDKAIANERDEGDKLRRDIIYQDYINRGFSKERAIREMEKSFKGGTDIDDARECLKSVKEYYKAQYDKLMDDARQKDNEEREKYRKQGEELRTSILEKGTAYSDLELDKNTRQRIYDSIVKPVYTDPDTGEKYSAIQKFEMENRVEFLKNVGLMYVLTDGFKSLDGLVKGKVKKEMKKGLRELEHTINNTSRSMTGTLRYVSGVDSNSRSSKWDIDI